MRLSSHKFKLSLSRRSPAARAGGVSTAHSPLPTAQSESGRAKLSTLLVFLLLISVSASALVVVRSHAAEGRFPWPTSLSRIFAGRSARTLSPPAPFVSGVTLTATAGTASGSFTTLKGAFDAINAGTHQGDIAISINADTTETASAILNASGSGAASYSSISIQPSGGATRTITGNLAVQLIDLNGADNVTIDGLNTGGNSLTISNTSTAGTYTLDFQNDATNNTIQNCAILGSSASTGTGTIAFFGGTTTGNDGNIINNNSIGPAGVNLPTNAIFASGNAASNSGVQITNNKIFDFFGSLSNASSGILVSTGNTDWTITGNSFYQTASRSAAGSRTDTAILISNSSGNNFTVSNNFIGGDSANASVASQKWTITGTATAYKFVGIQLNVGTTTPSSVQNNTIANFSWLSSSNGTTLPGLWCGIYVSAGSVNVGTSTGNTIGSSTGTGNITVTNSSTSSANLSFGIGAGSSGTIGISNNSIGSVTTASSGSAFVTHGFVGIQTTGGTNTIGGNLIGSTSTANSINASNGGASSAAGQAVAGIISSSATSASITNNTIANLNNNYSGNSTAGQIRGIVTTAGVNVITSNTIRNLSTVSLNSSADVNASVLGIGQTSIAAGQTISQNTIHSLSNSSGSGNLFVIGIEYSGPTSGTNLVSRNFIHSLSTSGVNSFQQGMRILGGTATYQNNMIRLGVNAAGSSITTSVSVIGISKLTSTNNNFYFNSIFIGGTGVVSTGAQTEAFQRGATATDDIRNNVFVNTRSNASGSGKHYAYEVALGGSLTSDYNLYYVSGSGGILAVTSSPLTDRPTLADVQSATGQDTHSLNADPLFATPNGTSLTVDLHVSNTSPVGNVGFGIGGITNDFDNDTRNSPPDIGADEFTSAPSISKSFLTSPINISGTSVLRIVVTNSNPNSLTGVAFTDSLPAGLTAPNSSTSQCGGTLSVASNVISLSGATVSPNSTCSSDITVTGTTSGTKTNTTGNVTSTNGGTGNTGSAQITVNDTTPPTISYSALADTASTSNRTLPVTVTDTDSGVPTSGLGLPVIYFRKGTSGAYSSSQCSFVSGNSYSCVINNSSVGGVTVNDTIQYYVAAQDSASTPNVTTSPLTGASGFTASPPAASTPPTTPSSYSITSPGSLQFSSATYSDSETNADHTFNVPVTRSGGSTGAVSVNYSVTDGTATTADTDYAISPASGTLDWADGDTAAKNIAITIKGDTKYEGDETVNIAITSPTGGATLGSPNTAVLTITNDDTQPDFAIADVSQAELNSGSSNMTFTVTKSGTTGLPSTVNYSTTPGTATQGTCGTAGNDYESTSGLLTFAAGETTKTISVPVCGDATPEPDETFTVQLATPTSATISDASATGTIQNDDGAVTYKWNPTSVTALALCAGQTTAWICPANWEPLRPTAASVTPTTDILVFDGTTTSAPLITQVPNQTIAALQFKNGINEAKFEATLAPATLTINGNTGSDLSIEAGSVVRLQGANAITLSLTAAGQQGVIAGNLIFEAAAHKLTGANTNEIVFQNGSSFSTTTGFSGHPFGSGTAQSVNFAGGSNSFYGAGLDPFGGAGFDVVSFGLVPMSNQEFSAATAFDSNGRAYGNLTLTGGQTFTGSGSGQLSVFGNFVLGSTSTFTLSSTAGGDMVVNGNFTDNNSSLTAFVANSRTVKFQGSAATQTIFKNSNRETFFDLYLAKTGGTVKLLNQIKVNGQLQFGGTGSAVDVLELNTAVLILNGTISAVPNANSGLFGDVQGAQLTITGSGALGNPIHFISGGEFLTSLSVDRNTVVSIDTNLTIGHATSSEVQLTDGVVDMGSNTLALNQNTVANRTNGYVVGNLKKTFGATGSFTFPVGTGTGSAYSPVDADVTSGVGNSLTVKAVAGAHPNVAGTKKLQRYWTLSNAGPVTVNLTFHYLASDVVGLENYYKIFKYDGSLTKLEPDTLDVTNHSATPNNVSSFSDWTLAQPTTTVSSLTANTPSPTNSANVQWTIVFADPISGLTTSNFSLVVSGLSGTSLVSVVPTGSQPATTWTITASTGSGQGTLGVDMVNDTNLSHSVTNQPFTGAVYTVDLVAPSTTSFVRFNPATATTSDDTLVFRATFSEDVQNVDPGDFAVNSTSTATVTSVTPVSASVYDVTVSGGDLAGYNGTVNLNLSGTQNITDLAGNALPAGEPSTDETYTVSNAPTPGAALNFDGNDDSIDIQPISQLTNSPGFTFETWIKLTDYTAGNIIFLTGANSTIQIQANGSLLIALNGLGVNAETNSFLPLNTWGHLALVFDGTGATNADRFKVYFDGVLQSVINVSGTFPANIGNAGLLRIGASGGCCPGPNGSMDEVRIWSVARSQSEISADMSCELSGAACLLASYHFNQGIAGASNSSETTLIDATGNGHNGTLSNFALAGATSNWIAPGGVVTGNTCAPHLYSDIDVRGGSPQVSIADGDNTPSATDGTDFGSQNVGSSVSHPFTIANTGSATLTLTGTPYVQITGAGASQFTVNPQPASGTVVAGDTTTSTFTINFFPTGGAATATVHIANDDCDEGDYDFAIQGNGNDVVDVSVAVSPTSVSEDGGTNLVYTFTRTGATTSPLTVNFTVGGTADPNTDYGQTGAATFTPPTGTVTFTTGSSTATVTIDPNTDSVVESDETVDLTVDSGAGYNVGSPSSASGTIANDDTDVSVAVSPSSVTEDGVTNLVYTFTRTGVTATALTVNFTVGGSATFPVDYAQSGAATFTATSGTVTFTGGSSTATVTIDPETDGVVEPDETVDLTVASGTGYNAASPTSASGTVTNDDTDVSVAVSPAAVDEDGVTNLVYTFTRNGVTTGALTVNFTVGGTADPNTDYIQTGAATFTPPTGTVAFTAGSSTATVTIDPTADSVVEPDETVDLTVASGTGYNVGSPSSASGTITNDDTDVSVAVSPASVTEDGATNLVYTFTRNGVTATPLTVNFTVGGSATYPTDYAQSGADTFTATAGTVTFTGGSSTATVTVDPAVDSTVEPDETVDLTVAAGTGYNVASPGSASGTITNDDTDVSVAVSPAAVNEDGATNLVYTFTRTGVTSGALTVNFTVGGTADPNTDFIQSGAATFTPPTGTATFTAGSSTATVTIDPTTDSVVEPDETVDLTVASGTGYNVGSPSSASGTITNDDTDVSVAVSPASVAEDGATNLVYTFTRTGVTASALTVNFTVGGSATFPTDYAQSGAATFTATTGTVTFTGGSSTATVTVDPAVDSTVEPDETVDLTVASGTGYNVASPSSASGTITNDDTDVSVTVSPASVTEDGATNLVYTFNRNGITSGTLTANFSVGGTANPSNDYVQSGAATFTPPTGTVTFTAGSSTATVTIDPTSDISYEPSETVILTVTSGTGYNVAGVNSAATGTITDDDSIPSTLVVTKTADTDDGFCSLDDCSLREAISNANTNPDPNTINFNIPISDPNRNVTTGVFTISPGSALPAITNPVTIDGYSQTPCSGNPAPCSQQNTLAVGSDAVLLIELDGTNSGGYALIVDAGVTVIKGLAINRSTQSEIWLRTGTGISVRGNFIGTDAAGAADLGSTARAGVEINAINGNTIGGPNAADRNVISGGGAGIFIINGSSNNMVQNNYIGTDKGGTLDLGNTTIGVVIDNRTNNTVKGNLISGNDTNGIEIRNNAAGGTANIVQGNLIGTKSDGTNALPNGGHGIFDTHAAGPADVGGNTIGGTGAGAANTIAFNGGDGVFVSVTPGFTISGTVIRGNSIHSNTGLGIDLSPDGVTPNDSLDPDTGANSLQNFPVITRALVGGPNTIRGTLNSSPSQTYTIDLYSNVSCDTVGGNGEGKTYLGSTTVTTAANGDGSWSFGIGAVTAGEVLTATATDASGSTSEFSQCFTATTFMPGTIGFAVTNTDDTETNAGSHPVNITVTRTGGSDEAVSVDWAVTDGPAGPSAATTADNDYSISPSSGTFTWGDGDTTPRTITVTVNGDTKFELDEIVTLTLSNVTGGASSGTLSSTLTIKNDDTEPTISINDVTHNEGAAGTTSYIFTVSLSNASYLPINVNYATADDTATAPTDYTAIPTTAVPTFAPNETSKQVTVLVNGDNTFETTEQFFVNLTSPSNATILDSQGVGTITNDDPVPTISINDVTQTEGDGPGTTNFDFTVSLTNPSYLPITVDYATSDGTASSLSDYNAVPTTPLTFDPGQTSKIVSVQVNGDFGFENNETFFVDLSNLSNATMGDSHGVGTITNDDTPPELTINDRSLNEGTTPGPTTPFTFTVTRTVADATSSVDYATANGSSNPATGGAACGAGVDYVSKSGTLNFPASGPGATSQTITVLVCKDAVFEPNETFVVNLSNAVDATITDNQGAGTILNDDVPGTGFLVNTTNDIDDGNCNVAHCSLREAINATNTALTAVAINFGIPANDPGHFYYSNDGVAGQVTNDGSHVLPTSAVDDTTIVGIDPDWPHSWWSILPASQLPALTKQVFVDGYSQTGATVNTLTAGDNAVLRIELDGESAGLVVQGLAVNAGVSTVRGLVINRFKFDAGDSNPTGVGLRVGGTGSTVTGNFIGADVSGTLDLGNEGSGIYVLGSSAAIGGNTADVVNLISGNNLNGILFSNSNSNVVLGNLIGTKANGTGALGNNGSGINLVGGGSVFNTIGGPDAGEGNTITFNGVTGGDGVQLNTAGFGNSIRGNSIYSNGSGLNDLGIDLAADGLTSNDAKDPDSGSNNQQNFPVITSALVTGSTKTITGTLNSTVGDTFTIDFYKSPACDTVGGNGEGKVYLGFITTAATDANGDVSFTFHPTGLTLADVGQVITATATSTGASFNTSEFSACFGIANGAPGAGDIQFTSANYSVAENVGSHQVAITLTRVGGSNGSISSPFTMSGGTATSGVDYTDASQTVTFNEGETSKTINVTITDDSTYEGNETVNMSLGSSSINAAQPDDSVALVADPHAAVLTITENDPAPTLAIDDVTHLEGNSGTTSYLFTVTKSGSTALNTGVSFTTANGTATLADNDYQAFANTLTFGPSETTKTINVLVNGDTTVESNETFVVNLSSPTNATITDNQGLGTITNDDTDVTVTVSPASAAEDGSPNLVYTFTRNGVTSGTQTVTFSVGGTATFATDYTQSGAATFTASTGTVTFGAGNTTATVTIDPAVDSTVESDETVILTVTAAAGYNAASPSAATGTITNDDTNVTVAVSPTSVAEDGVANLVYTFTRTGVTTGALTANFSVGGTASLATDYTQSGAATFTASSGTVNFGAGNSTATVTVDPTPDTSFEADETVILTLTSGTGYNVASPSSATGTITNDDAAGGIIRFSSATYNTTENSRFIVITVERVGETSGAATVNYSTPDDSESNVAVPCSTINGSASPRCDFTTALGTLRWAAGDGASKTFTVLISQDNYVEGPETLTLSLSNPTGGAVFGVPSTATLTIADDATEPAANPIDDAGNFVRQQYHDFLNREPDQAGLDFWTNEITSCGSNQQCIDFKRVQVSAAFYLSIEFQDTGYLVERLYKSAYGDGSGASTFGGPHQLPVPIVRYTEFLGDTQEIGLGVVVGQGNWQLQLENNKQAFADKFVQRSRFITAFPLSMTPAQFVDKLNQNAGSPLSQSERDQLVADLTSSAKTRAQVLRAVADDQDLKTAEFNRAFVLMQYFGYLRRNPNVAQDTDYSGFDFWLTKLNQFEGNFQNADMVKAFITSAEYRNRSGP